MIVDMKKGIIGLFVLAILLQCQARTNMRTGGIHSDIFSIDSLVVVYDPDICPGEIERYVAQSADEFFSYNDLPKIIEKNDSILNSFFNNLSKAKTSNQKYIDTDLAVVIFKHDDIDTLILSTNPICSCELNSKHLYCPEAYLDIVEIVMKADDKWRQRYVNELKIMLDYYLDSEELQKVPGNRVRKLISAYDKNK